MLSLVPKQHTAPMSICQVLLFTSFGTFCSLCAGPESDCNLCCEIEYEFTYAHEQFDLDIHKTTVNQLTTSNL